MKQPYWLFLSLLLSASPSLAQQATDAYTFPVKPGTEQWKQFKTGQAMVDASQVPVARLQKMSTPGLVTTCLNYPLLSTMLAHNNLQLGFQTVAIGFNGLQELLRRPDAGTELLKLYQRMDPTAVQGKDAAAQGAYTLEFTYVELLLAQPTILDKLSVAERKTLSRESLAKFKAKDNHLDAFGGFGESTSALVLGRVLEKDNYSAAYRPNQRSTAMQTFLQVGQVTDTQVINQIVADTQAYLK